MRWNKRAMVISLYLASVPRADKGRRSRLAHYGRAQRSSLVPPCSVRNIHGRFSQEGLPLHTGELVVLEQFIEEFGSYESRH